MTEKRLVIISHTPHYVDNGVYYGWGPTVKEINKVAAKFDSVLHFAPLHAGSVPGGNLPYTSPNVQYVELLEAGGTNLLEKIKLLLYSPANVFIILKQLRRNDWIQVRAPSNIALVMLPVFSILRYYYKWVKYAGNWNEPSPPLTFRIQRWWLKNNIQGSYVTVNGKWEKEGKHILAFENPCMDENVLAMANNIAQNKRYEDPINICFVGQLDANKGSTNLLDALKLFSAEDVRKINKVLIVGDGALMDTLKEKKKDIPVNVELLGYLNHNEVGKVYAEAHVNILPSKSEGFPKVIAEGAAYGCIPVVTDMSSLSQYINVDNGVLLPDNSPQQIYMAIKKILDADPGYRKKIADNATRLARKFTYEYYIKRLFTEIIDK